MGVIDDHKKVREVMSQCKAQYPVAVEYVGPDAQLKHKQALMLAERVDGGISCRLQFNDKVNANGSWNRRAFGWHPAPYEHVKLIDPDVELALKKSAEARIESWEGGECYCSATTHPPCGVCENPESPENIRLDDDSWEWRCKHCGGVFSEQPLDGRCDYDDCTNGH